MNELNNKIKQALKGLHTLNARLAHMERSLAFYNRHCHQLISKMQTCRQPPSSLPNKPSEEQEPPELH